MAARPSLASAPGRQRAILGMLHDRQSQGAGFGESGAKQLGVVDWRTVIAEAAGSGLRECRQRAQDMALPAERDRSQGNGAHRGP